MMPYVCMKVNAVNEALPASNLRVQSDRGDKPSSFSGMFLIVSEGENKPYRKKRITKADKIN